MYTLIDLRGFIIRSYSAGIDEDGVYDVEKNETINSAQYGLETFLSKYLAEWSKLPKDKMIFCLEGGNQLRTTMFPDYKGKRNKDWSETKSKEINKAQSLVIECLGKLGFLTARQEGMEADDLIAYFCKELEGSKLVHTVDGDLKVLSGLPEVTVGYHSPRTMDVDYVTGEVDGLPAMFVTLNKSIVGDSSDNYPGIKGMGPKAWDNLVAEYGVEGLLEINRYVSKHDWAELESDAKEMDCKLLQKLFDNKEEWLLSYELAKMYPQLINSVSGRKMSLIDWVKRVPDQIYIAELIDNLDDDEGGADWIYHLMPEFTLVTSDNYSKCIAEVEELFKKTSLISWDYEAYDPVKSKDMQKAYAGRGEFVDVLSQSVTGCSFAIGPFCSKVYYFSANHAETENIPHDKMKKVMEMFFNSKIEMVAQNIQFEASVTKTNFDLEVPYWTDTAMFAKNLFEDAPSGLKGLSKTHLDYNQQTYQETLGDASGMNELTGEHVLSYACDDSLVTAHLLFLFRIFAELEGTRHFIEDYDCNSLAILVDGFVEGVDIDVNLLNALAEKDAIDREAAMRFVRAELVEHCSVANTSASAELFKDIKPFEKAKMKDKGVTDYMDKLSVIEGKILEASIYKTPASIYKEVEFKPTTTQINKVIGYLEGSTDEPTIIDNVSAKGLTEFFIEQEGVAHSPEIADYLRMLATCAGKQMKTRAGDDYAILEAYSAKVLQENSVPIKVGTELNFGSPNQMIYLLYAMLGLPIRLRTKMQRGSKREQLGFSEGGPSTQENAMQLAIAEDCTGENTWKAAILKGIIVINKCTTRAGLYWTPYPLWRHPRDGKLHPQIKQSATVTNRPTGSSPNLLQVSKKDGGFVRSIFVGGETDDGEDYIYVSIDFSGQELRIIASETKDPVMLDAYMGAEKKDLHTVTACAIGKNYISKVSPSFDLNRITWDGDIINYDFFARIREEEPKDDMDMVKLFKLVRAAAKTINFGVAYGAGPQTIARGLFIPVELAKSLMEALFARFVELPRWKDRVWEGARKKGYVATVYGSRRHCWPDIISRDSALKGRMERQVANFLIQGTAADILKIVMTNAKPIFEDTGAILHGPIYDEIASRVPRSNVASYIKQMSDIMAITPPGHEVPMVPEASIGRNWGFQKELGAFPSASKIEKALEGLYEDET